MTVGNTLSSSRSPRPTPIRPTRFCMASLAPAAPGRRGDRSDRWNSHLDADRRAASATYPLTVTVTDAGGLAAQSTFNVTINSPATTGGGGTGGTGGTSGTGFGLGAEELGIGVSAFVPVAFETITLPSAPANTSTTSFATLSTSTSSGFSTESSTETADLGGAGDVTGSTTTTNDKKTGDDSGDPQGQRPRQWR